MASSNSLHGAARRSYSRTVSVGALAFLLAGCVTFTSDGGMAPVSAEVSSQLGAQTLKVASKADASKAEAAAKAILAKPLTADSAVQLALYNNRGLQADYNALGISEAAYVEASLLPNPVISVGQTLAEGDLQIERRLAASVLSLLTLPARREVAALEFEATRYRAIGSTLRLAANTRKAYYRAVTARQKVGFLEQARKSADAAAILTRSLGQSGAASKLDQARASAFYAEVSNQLAAARLEAATAREELTRELGVWGTDLDYKIPAQLPKALPRIEASEKVEAEAIRKRVDLIAARLELDALARSLNLGEATRYVSALELAGFSNFSRSKENGAVSKDTVDGQGLELALEIPIFDFGETTRRRSVETYMQAVNRFAEKAVNVRSEARTALLAYRASYDISNQYRTQILPLRKTVNEESLLQYNGMLIDVFDLLTTFEESIETNIDAITAKRDVFIASVDFKSAVMGNGSGGTEPSVARAGDGD